ncbi:MAG: glycerol kinase GlpK [Chloroflexi bacterium]|nr:glycerol kinase GlpK [Chloroflexota bacterium]
MPNIILSLDQGTTSSRAILFDHSARVASFAQQEFPQIYPQPGWVEHDPEAIWRSQLHVAREALTRAGATARDVAAIGVTNQRETTIIWDRRTGQPVTNAIVWQCRRTADECARLREAGHEALFRARTGLVLDAYFSGTKIAWILDHVPDARRRAEQGELAFGTVDTFLIWRLTGGLSLSKGGGAVHATDPSNASRTLLFDIARGQWDDDLLRILNIPRALLPEVRPSSGDFGLTDPQWFGEPIPIRSVAGDQKAATFGQACFDEGLAKNTYGTGCFMLMNTGPTPTASHSGLLTTVGWLLRSQMTYCLEGSVFIAGAAIQWLRDALQIIERADQTAALAASVDDTGGVYLVPAFVGLGAPYWDALARGALVGLTRGTSRAHIARAALEAIAYQSRDVLEAMESDAGKRLKTLRVDGGAAANDWLMQFQADILNVPVERPAITETTALGAAYLAGLAVNYWRGTDEIRAQWQVERVFTPRMKESERERLYAGWKQAVERVRR